MPMPLILLPGLLNDHRLWSRVSQALAPFAEVSVASVDGENTMTALAQSVLRNAPDRFALAGLSMGGYVALEIMRQAPERVLALALVDTQARPDTPETSEKRREQIRRSQTDFDGVVADLYPKLVHPDFARHSESADLFRSMAQAVGVAGFERQQSAIMGRADSRPSLPDITCPTLVLCGRQDAVTPVALHEEMAKGIPGARLEIVEDCGHLSALEKPEAVAQAMTSWLRGAELAVA